MFGLNQDQTLHAIYLMLLLVLVVGSTAFGWGRVRSNVRHLFTWALIGLALVAVYAYRTPLQRFAAPVLQQFTPARVVEVTSPDGAKELTIARGADGHFHIDAEANGTRVRFLVDTGASSTVLTQRDAERAGIDVNALNFDRPVQTANGIAFFARADLRSLQIGPYRIAPVSVGVTPDGALDTSLLGMSTINRFKSWRVDGDQMVLVP